MASIYTDGFSSWSTNYDRTFILEPIVNNEDLWASDVYLKDTMINGSKTWTLSTEIKNMIQAKACGWTPQGSGTLGELTLSVCPLMVQTEQCFTEFTDTQFRSVMNNGSDIPQLGGTIIGDMIASEHIRGISTQSFDLGWFGDTTLSTSTNLQYCDGWFKRLEDEADVQKITIASTGDLAADEAFDTLKLMWNASKELKAVGKQAKLFLVTCTVAENLLETYENLGTDSGLRRAEDGKETLLFRGVEVREQTRWDGTITEQSFLNPHRIVYTAKQNLMLGTDINNQPGSDMRIYLDPKTNEFCTSFMWDFGTQILFKSYSVYAR